MEESPAYRKYENVSLGTAKDLLVSRDLEIEKYKSTVSHLESQLAFMKSQNTQTKANLDTLSEHYKYKESSFKQEKEDMEKAINNMREEFEMKVGFLEVS